MVKDKETRTMLHNHEQKDNERRLICFINKEMC